MTIHSHPAYTKPTLPTVAGRAALANGIPGGSDPAAGVQKIFDLSLRDDIPLHFALGKDALGGIKVALEGVAKDIAKLESWSDGLDGMVGFDA